MAYRHNVKLYIMQDNIPLLNQPNCPPERFTLC